MGTKRLLIALSAAIATAAAVSFLAVQGEHGNHTPASKESLRGDSSSNGHFDALYLDHASFDDLVRSSTVIVEGEFLGERQQESAAASSAGHVDDPAIRTDVIRQFRVTASLLGPAEKGVTIDVWQTARLALPAAGSIPPDVMDVELEALTPGTLYVLFLHSIYLSPTETVLAPNGWPAFAESSGGGRLTFVVPDQYVARSRDNGRLLSGARIPASFDGRVQADVAASLSR